MVMTHLVFRNATRNSRMFICKPDRAVTAEVIHVVLESLIQTMESMWERLLEVDRAAATCQSTAEIHEATSDNKHATLISNITASI